MHLDSYAQEIRKIILEQSYRAGVGHIGSALCIADIMSVIYFGSHSPGNFILSKGHAALAQYACLFLKGLISQESLDAFCSEGSLLGVHPEPSLAGVEVATGSLGQGVCIALGKALSKKIAGSGGKVLALLSDAECNEGCVWEAAMFASQHRMDNLVLVIDNNGQQALGNTEDIIDLKPLREKWISFGWKVYRVDGHDTKAMDETLSQIGAPSGKPQVIIADTIFGKGVSWMESELKWHYLPMSEEQFRAARREVLEGRL